MKILSWNCQGLGNPLIAGALSDWCWRECPNIVFLMETMICKKHLERIRNRCGFTIGLYIGSRGRSAVKVRKENEEGWWKGIGIYGWPELCNKYKTWDMLRSLCYGDNIPTILFGDFNEILSNNEKEGGAFRNALDDCALHDLGFTGNKFTWQRGKEVGRMIRERLDRAVHNFPICYSDHAALLIMDNPPQKICHKRKNFKFEPFWLSDPECKGIVEQAWGVAGAGRVADRIKMCGQKLSTCRVREKEEELYRWQRKEPSADMLNKCHEITRELEARKCELRDGDKNTGYFHHKAKQRRKKNFIKGLEGEDGRCSNPNGINEALECVDKVVNDEYNKALDANISEEEASGPDGLHAVFYQKHWDIVGDAIVDFNNELNTISVVLIPKCQSPRKIVEYRPISLYNVVYKIISKLMANRAFTPGRSISDNALIAFEIFHAMKRKGEGRVEWCFLERWVERIMRCVSRVTHSFIINGRKAAVAGQIHGARVCRGAILFARANKRECSVLADIISNYERASGQKINYTKSYIIKNVLRVRQVDRHEKYLGIPTIIGRSKKAIFTSLKERIWKKTQGWKEKLLSRAGKEVLINIFLLPEGSVEDIQATMARFWWGSSDSQRKIHWMRWDKLCKPKALGGLVFRDIRTFNIALLAKKLWRLVEKPESLVARARLGYDPSYTWRSIWSSKSVLLEGLKWRAWLPGATSALIPKPKQGANMELKEDDVELVLQLPLSTRLPADIVYWWPRDNGAFSGPQNDESAAQCWRLIWNLNIPPKLSHFAWRVCSNTLAVKANLFRHHITEEASCKTCGNAWEDVWTNSGFEDLLLTTPRDGGIKLIEGFLQQLDNKDKCDFLVRAWAAWTVRNSILFDETPISPRQVLIGFSLFPSIEQTPRLISGDWRPPPEGVIKINTDAAVYGDREGGLGAVYRNDCGARWAPFVAEAAAARFGMEVTICMGLRDIVLESDSLKLVKSIVKKQERQNPSSLIIGDILVLVQSFITFTCLHVKRGANTVAHSVARLCMTVGDQLFCTSDFLSAISELAAIDLI
ncbi:hypothetical protein RND81_10G119900 [Saponaria officinalis]|uniref:Reverse transcriptase n=1 Tax=Saponaria officinalis TaxID=3572 RepID=A0AAW1I1T4_SAPOF